MESFHNVLNPKLCECTPLRRREVVADLDFLKDSSLETVGEFQKAFSSMGMAEGMELSPLKYPGGLFGIVATGALKVFRYVKEDQFVILDVLTEGDFFHYGLQDALGVRMFLHPDQIQALTTTCLLFMENRKLEGLLQKDTSLVSTYLQSMSRKLGQLHERFIHISAYPAEHRLAYLLGFLRSKGPVKTEYPNLIPFNITRKDLASMAGLTLETASRILASFERSGLIRSGRGWVEILNAPELEKLCRTEKL